MFFPDRKIVERIKKEYPSGTRVELVELNDPYRHLPAGLQGTVSCVDRGMRTSVLMRISWQTLMSFLKRRQ